jgi:hypothetical protein
MKQIETPKLKENQRSMSILPSKTQTKQRKDDNLLSFLDEPAIPPTEKYGPTKIKINQHYEKPKELRNHPI